jgi:hypothetical protein
MKNASVVFRREKELEKIPHTDENLPVSERRHFKKRKPQGFEGWPEEKNEYNDDLWSDEKIGKESVFKNRFFHKNQGRMDPILPL